MKGCPCSVACVEHFTKCVRFIRIRSAVAVHRSSSRLLLIIATWPSSSLRAALHLSYRKRTATMQEACNSPCCGIPCCDNTEPLLNLKCGHSFCIPCLAAQKKNRLRKPTSVYEPSPMRACTRWHKRGCCPMSTRIPHPFEQS